MKYIKKNRLSEIDYWEEVHNKIVLDLSDDNPIKNWLSNNFNFTEIKNCFEIGCFPGKFLTIFAEKGIEINGIDFVSQTKELKEELLKKSYLTGDIICADFLDYEINRKFDCVCSFGFIEHFKNWEEILKKQIDLVNSNGYIILECPNFKGIYQRIPRYLFDRKNFLQHNLSSMDLDKWREILVENNFEIIYVNYFLGYDLWFEKQYHNRYILYMRRIIIKFLTKLVKLYRKKDHKSFSAAMGIIAVKK